MPNLGSQYLAVSVDKSPVSEERLNKKEPWSKLRFNFDRILG